MMSLLVTYPYDNPRWYNDKRHVHTSNSIQNQRYDINKRLNVKVTHMAAFTGCLAAISEWGSWCMLIYVSWSKIHFCLLTVLVCLIQISVLQWLLRSLYLGYAANDGISLIFI